MLVIYTVFNVGYLGMNAVANPDRRLQTVREWVVSNTEPSDRIGAASYFSVDLGISTHVQAGRALVQAACLASLYCPDLIVERMVFGESYRLLYLDGEFLHAVRRRGAHVVGDGATDIRGLLKQDGVFGLERDRNSLLTLRAQRLEHGSVPLAGRDVLVRSLPDGVRGTRELRTEYDEDVTELICDSIRREGSKVVTSIGVRLAGVDLILCDPTLPLAEGGGVFIEVNGTPGIHHHYIDDGRGVPLAIPVVARMLGLEFPGTPIHSDRPVPWASLTPKRN